MRAMGFYVLFCGSVGVGLGVSGCGSSDASRDAMDAGGAAVNGASDAGLDANPLEPGDAAAADALPDAPNANGIVVSGHVISDLDLTQPIANRQVILLDAMDRRVEATTDQNGAFSAAGVVVPYDCMVSATTSGPKQAPMVLVGLSTAHPRLLGAPDSVPSQTSAWRSATIALPIVVPACGSASCPTTVSIFDYAHSGLNVGGGFRSDLVPSQVYTAIVDVSWFGETTATVAMKILSSDATYQHFFVASTSGYAVTDTVASTAAPATPASVPTLGNVTLTVDAAAVPPTWGSGPQTGIYLTFPNKEGFAYLPQITGTSIVSGVPNILGATMTFQSAAIDRSNANDYYRSQTYALSGPLPLSTTGVDLRLHPPVALTAPAIDGELSASTGRVQWTTDSMAQFTEVDFFGAPPSRMYTLIVQTSQTSFDMSRLAKLGVTLATGPAAISATTQGAITSLDAMIDEGTLLQPDGTMSTFSAHGFAVVP